MDEMIGLSCSLKSGENLIGARITVRGHWKPQLCVHLKLNLIRGILFLSGKSPYILKKMSVSTISLLFVQYYDLDINSLLIHSLYIFRNK